MGNGKFGLLDALREMYSEHKDNFFQSIGILFSAIVVIFTQNPWLAFLFVVAFGQNMAFTWVSRSRNSGDYNYHRWAAVCSNGVWLACQLFIWGNIWAAFTSKEFLDLIPLFLVYTAATTEGSVFMMRILKKVESGKRKVGA